MREVKWGRRAILVLVLFLMLGTVTPCMAAGQKARDAVDSVVLVATPYGTGSGFAIGKPGKPVPVYCHKLSCDRRFLRAGRDHCHGLFLRCRKSIYGG